MKFQIAWWPFYLRRLCWVILQWRDFLATKLVLGIRMEHHLSHLIFHLIFQAHFWFYFNLLFFFIFTVFTYFTLSFFTWDSRVDILCRRIYNGPYFFVSIVQSLINLWRHVLHCFWQLDLWFFFYNNLLVHGHLHFRVFFY